MTRLKKTALSILAACTASVSGAATLHKDGHFFTKFEDFNGWTTVDINGDAWGDNKWVYDWYEKTAMIKNGYVQCDDWLFSPAVKFESGKNYAIKIRYQSEGENRFSVSYGNAATIESQNALSEMTTYSHGSGYVVFHTPAITQTGNYNVGIHCASLDTDYYMLTIRSVEIIEDNDGSLALTLSNAETEQPIQNVEISLSGEFYGTNSIKTDERGRAEFKYLTPGEYTYSYSLDGYEPAQPRTLTIGNKEDVSEAIKAVPLAAANVSGFVVDYKEAPLQNVTVNIYGEKNFTAVTDADGHFSIDNVPTNEKYTIELKKKMYRTYSSAMDMGQTNLNLGNLTLENYFGSPVGVTANPTEVGMFVSWMVQAADEEFVYDNGSYAGCHTVSGDNVNYVRYGVKFAEPMILEEVKWLAAYVEDGKVDLAVYLLDKNGNISSSPAFEKRDVPCETYNWEDDVNWQYHKLSEPVEAAYGCLISIGHESIEHPIQICFDYQNNGGPSYTSYNDIETGWKQSKLSNFMIRAKGIELTHDVSFMSKSMAKHRAYSKEKKRMLPAMTDGVTFNAWRMTEDDIENSSNWVSLGANIRDLFTIDSQFDNLPQGVYRYAVQAVSHSGEVSDMSFSAPIRHNLATDVRVFVYTNSAVDFSEGALVTLKSASDATIYSGTTDSNGLAYFNSLPKGIYTLSVERFGFEPYTEDADYSTNETYLSQIPLSLIPMAPFAIEAKQAEGSNDVEISWNNTSGIFEDFENMEDFAINPQGDAGWTYADVDGDITFGISKCENTPYPNMFAPMAFMAFNPSATNPDMSSMLQPYSGKKMLISAGLQNGGRNDDYLFSPELDADKPAVFRFKAASGFYAALGMEEFMVGYTVEQPKPENVIWITKQPVAVNGMWTEFCYALPAGAKHAVLRCVSDQCMFFMVDDIFIGCEEADIFAMTTFNVYLDKEFVGNTSGRSITFSNLDQGKHIVEIQTVYPMLESGDSYSTLTDYIFRVENSHSGLEDATNTDNDATPEYYTVDGIRVDGEPSVGGVYIKVVNGKATKVTR